ncbi:MAG: hypothetical protein IPK28_15050 [Devosia sp.]|nr:hypothetical protein [Devosia sp.]
MARALLLEVKPETEREVAMGFLQLYRRAVLASLATNDNRNEQKKGR